MMKVARAQARLPEGRLESLDVLRRALTQYLIRIETLTPRNKSVSKKQSRIPALMPMTVLVIEHHTKRVRSKMIRLMTVLVGISVIACDTKENISAGSNSRDIAGHQSPEGGGVVSDNAAEPATVENDSLSLVAAPSGLRHPGVLVNAEQIALLKEKIAQSAQPWKKAYDIINTHTMTSPSYTPKPWKIVECGPYNKPNLGCADEVRDSLAAYTNALTWVLSGNQANATKAIEIMDAWRATLTKHTNHNAPLQAAWAASMWARAAEIMRYSPNRGRWSATAVNQFGNWLKTVHLPRLTNLTAYNGNWDLSQIEATMAIAVFLDDRALFNTAVARWRQRTPAYIYLRSDGPLPKLPPGESLTQAQLISFWYGQTQFTDGHAQETCRDFGHTQMGLGAMINAAETARIQGVNLYSEQKTRIVAALESHAKYLNGAPIPSSLCGGKLTLTRVPMWEIGYNHYANRDFLSLPQTNALILATTPKVFRPSGVYLHMAWETLTHAGVGSAGLPK